MVLNGRNWSPVRAYSSAGGTTAWTASTAASGPLVAVVIRIAEQRAALVDQAVVDRPRVEPDADQPRGRPSRLAQPGQDLAIEPEDVPVEPVGQPDGLVREAMDLGQLEVVRADPADHHPTARRAEVDGRDEPAGHRRKAAATPASTGMWRPVVWLRSPPVRANTAAATCSGQDLLLEQRPLGIELAELVLGDAVGPGAIGAPALGEDARPAHDAVGVHAVDPDPERAELGGEQPDLVGLVGLRRAVGDVVRAGEQGVLADDVDDVAAEALLDHDPGRLARDEERAAGHDVVLEVPVVDGRLEQRLRDRQAGVVDDEVDAAERERRSPGSRPRPSPRR